MEDDRESASTIYSELYANRSSSKHEWSLGRAVSPTESTRVFFPPNSIPVTELDYLNDLLEKCDKFIFFQPPNSKTGNKAGDIQILDGHRRHLLSTEWIPKGRQLKQEQNSKVQINSAHIFKDCDEKTVFMAETLHHRNRVVTQVSSGNFIFGFLEKQSNPSRFFSWCCCGAPNHRRYTGPFGSDEKGDIILKTEEGPSKNEFRFLYGEGADELGRLFQNGDGEIVLTICTPLLDPKIKGMIMAASHDLYRENFMKLVCGRGESCIGRRIMWTIFLLVLLICGFVLGWVLYNTFKSNEKVSPIRGVAQNRKHPWLAGWETTQE